MIKLFALQKTTTKSKKRVGRGYGSGVGGHTTGRGGKGQKIRSKVKLTNDGSKIKKSWLKRLPFLRGKGRNSSHLKDRYIVSLGYLAGQLKDNQELDLKVLSNILKINRVDLTNRGLKILSSVNKIDKAITVDGKVRMSRNAKAKIISAGGKIN